MRRSEIDALLREAVELLNGAGHALPPQAAWDLATWHAHRAEADELRRRGLGWDVTDFGSGDFHRAGLVCYTLCNGRPAELEADQPYASKLLVVRERQVTPLHHHWRKTEDIAVLGGGELEIRLFAVGPGDVVDRTVPVSLLHNSVRVTCAPGSTLRLGPGERVRLEPHHYHEFWARAGGGTVVAEEVSSVNDDATDNCFVDGGGRFPRIEEDARPDHLLCWELPGTEAFDRLAERWLA